MWPARRRTGVVLAGAASMLLVLPASHALAGTFSIAKTADTLVDSRGMTLANGAPYGTNINFTSFTQDAVTFFNGWQYTSYWVKDTSSGPTAYYMALARRQIGTTGGGAWQVMNVTGTTFQRGMRSSTDPTPWNAHNVVSLGICPNDGTLHLFYDTHSTAMRYRMSVAGVATNPAAVAWTPAILGAENSNLGTATSHPTTTYPAFVRMPDGNLQLFFRTGVSGNGSWRAHEYTAGTGGSSGTWNTGYQVDNGSTGTYAPLGSSLRNAYPNGFNYDNSGRLHLSFVYRENTGQGGNGTNHDILYVHSDDRGSTWRNNAGTAVSDRSAATTTVPDRWTVSSPGLVAVPMTQNNALMNQQAQRPDSAGRLHLAMWHLDTAQLPTTSNWATNDTAYFHYWRDDLGNWHRNIISRTGNWIRPKLFFDASDNAIALIYNNTTLQIAMASRESNWSDWRVVASESGYFSEPQADADLLAARGVLSIIAQKTPATSLAATEIRTLDHTFSYTPTVVKSFTPAAGDFSSPANWGGSVPGADDSAVVAAGRTAGVTTATATVGNRLLLGTAAGSGRLEVSAAGTLAVTGSILVGAAGGGVGTYEQTGGSVSTNYFVVGAFSSETSGGGLSIATVSGGTLTVGELRVAESADGSSSGSLFTQAGGSTTVNGELILADNGNTGTVSVTGGTLTVQGNLYKGFNKTNTARLRVNGGTLAMTGNTVTVDSLELLSGRVTGLGGFNAGAVITKDQAGVVAFGSNSFTNAVSVSAGSLRADHANALGTTGGNTTVSGGTSTGVVELSGGITLAEPFVLGGRQGSGADAPHLVNVSGTNTLTGSVGTTVGGNQYNVRSDAGLLIVSSPFANNQTSGVTDVRFLKLMGDAEGRWAGSIANGPGAVGSRTALTKSGGGTWTISATNSYTGPTDVLGGTLQVTGAHNGGGAYTVAAGGTLGGTGLIDLAAGSAVAVAGVLAPGAIAGGSAGGTLTIGSTASPDTVSLTGGELRIRLAAAGVSDRLIVRGTLDLASPLDRLRFVLTPGALDGSTYTLATFTPGTLGQGRFSSIFVNERFAGDGTGPVAMRYTLRYDDTAGTITLGVNQIPEPGAGMSLVALSTAVLMRRGRR